MNKKTKKLKGISLIVLVITILVLSILAATVIISLSNTNIISGANKAVLKSNIQSLQDRVTSYTADNYTSIDMKKEYTLSEYGITEEEFKKYQTIAVVKGGKIYIKPNASSDILEVAKELNVLLDATFSNTGSLELASTKVKSLRIYGNSIQNGTPSESTPVEIQSVGEKTTNLYTNGDMSFTAYKLVTLNTPLEAGTYTISLEFDNDNETYNKGLVFYFGESDSAINNLSFSKGERNSNTVTFNEKIYRLSFYATSTGATNAGVNAIYKNIKIEKGSTATSYEPYGYKVPVKTSGKNLLDVDNFISTFNQFKPAGYETTKTEFDGYECIKVFGTLKKDGINIQYLKDKFKSNTQYTFTIDMYDDSSESNSNKGITGIINYTDGSTDLFTLVAREFDVWQPISVVSKENKSIDYISFSFGTGAAYSYIKNWQIEEGVVSTGYEPYNATTYNIYLKEPLCKLGSTADYIDCTTGEVVRYIKVKDTTGTKSIEESFEVLTTPITEKVSVSDIDYTNKKYVSVDTTVTPSSIEARY